jgi:proteasome-associated ATPase
MAKLKREGADINTEASRKGFFIINGPELLSMWAGNTEAAIRDLWREARLTAQETGFPSVIFWDEIESITRKRTDSATFSPEKTIVPTILTELQGVNAKNNVILIGSSNRPDLIDPALMRPGRLGDIILEIPKPEKEAAMEILKAKLEKSSLPAGLSDLLGNNLIETLVNHIYENEKPIAVANLKDGSSMPLMRQEKVSGALFAQVGEEIMRHFCMAEIEKTDAPSIEKMIEMLDNIILSQLGVLDAGVNNGFTTDLSNYIVDVAVLD